MSDVLGEWTVDLKVTKTILVWFVVAKLKLISKKLHGKNMYVDVLF